MDNRFEEYDRMEQSPEIDRSETPLPAFPRYERKARSTGWKLGVAAVCLTLVGSLAGSAVTLSLAANLQQKAAEAAPEKDATYLLESRRETQLEILPVNLTELLTPAQVYARNVNSTVGITTAITTNFWGYQTTSAAAGSGFILSSDGYILTNYHVIEDSSSISVSLYDGTAYDAKLIGYDESNDIAVLKVEAEDLVPVILGNSDDLNVGDSVVAIGNPLGELTFSLTSGTVSAKDRKVTLSSTITMDLIQTDCAINSGNSGGALFNLYGEVIGITNAKYSSSSASKASIDNIGFAIPIDDVMHIVESIIEKGYVSKPYLGVTVSDVSAQTQLYGIPKGAAVQSVTENGPAVKAGLLVGDIITQVDGAGISGSAEMVEIVGKHMPGDTVVLTVYRQGQMLEISVTIEEQIPSVPESTASQQLPQIIPGNPGSGFSFGRR